MQVIIILEGGEFQRAAKTKILDRLARVVKPRKSWLDAVRQGDDAGVRQGDDEPDAGVRQGDDEPDAGVRQGDDESDDEPDAGPAPAGISEHAEWLASLSELGRTAPTAKLRANLKALHTIAATGA